MTAALLSEPHTAHASIFGEENATLGAILGEDIATFAEVVKTVAGIAEQITQLRNIIQQGATVIQSIGDAKNLNDIIHIADHTQQLVNSIEWDATLLKYKLQTIDRDREKIFGTLNDTPTSEFTAKAHTWNAALSESSAVAMRANTSVETLQARMDRMQALLQDTDNANNGTKGVVEMLQIIERSLALIHTDLAAIDANTAAGMRVTATMASIEAAEAERSEVIHKRMMDGYTNRGAPPKVLDKLP